MSAAYLSLLLADGRLPTGAHTQSAGLEPALNHGLRLDRVPDYLVARLSTVTEVEAAAAVAGMAAVAVFGAIALRALASFAMTLCFALAGNRVLTQVRAEHSSELAHKDAAGKEAVHPGGEPAGFIIEMENGFKIYHMGDTGLFGDMRDW